MYHLMGDYRQAVHTFQLALKDDSRLFPANLFLGLDLLQLNEPASAAEYLDRALRLEPRNEEATLAMGKAYTSLRQFEKANEYYERAARIDPGNGEALYGLGITYLQIQNRAAAVLGSTGSHSPYKLRLLAEFLAQQGRVNDAVHVYETVPPGEIWPGYHAELGFEYLSQDNVSRAKQAFENELTHNHGSLLAQLGLARVLLEAGNSTASAAALQKVWTTDRNFLPANAKRFWVGLTAQRAQELQDSLLQTTQGSQNAGADALVGWSRDPAPAATTLSPPLTPTSDDAGQAAQALAPAQLYQEGRYTECADRLKGGSIPLGHTGLLLLAECSYDSGNYRQSFKASGRVLKTEPTDPAALYWRALASSRLAAKMLLEAGAASPNSYRVHVLLGESYRQMGKVEDAESEYRKAVSIHPEREAAHLGLATVYWQQREYDKALPSLTKALSASPHDPEASFLMANILVARHQFAEAKPYATTALRAEGKTALYAHALLSRIYAAEGDTTAAINEIKLALSADEDGSLHFQLYSLYKKEGQTAAAAEALRESQAIQRQQAQTFRGALERSP